MIYADYSATTPVRPEVLEAMTPYYSQLFFNPSSVYPAGRQVREAVEKARARTADCIGAEAEEIIFTSGGTESDNMAIKGVALHPDNKKRHIITTEIEHHGVLEPCRQLEEQGFSVTCLPVDRYGRVSETDLRKAITEDTFLVSVMWVNNETGAVQDIKKLARIAHQSGAVFHTDAVQAMTTQPVDVREAEVDLLTISAHKFYGPKGCGALYCRKGIPVSALIKGGQQENHLRGGTENVPSLIGMGHAAMLLKENRKKSVKQMERLKERIVTRFSGREGILINSGPDYSAPSVCNIGFAGIEAEAVVFYMNRAGILISMGAACNTKSVEPSYVIRAMGVPEEYLRGCVRISLSSYMTETEADTICDCLEAAFRRLNR